MAENPTTQPIVETTDAKQLYIPSSVEKKRAILMYLLLGIMGSLGKKSQQSDFEYFHLKQAMGWRTMLVLILLVSAILLFIPLIKYIPLIAIVIMIIVLIICIKQANDGQYGRKTKNSLSLFSWIGEWMLGLFEIKQDKEV